MACWTRSGGRISAIPTVTFRDREFGMTIGATGLDVDLVRAASGHIRGSVQGRLAVGGEQAAVEAEADLVSGGESRLRVRLAPFRPAAIAGLPPNLAFLASAGCAGFAHGVGGLSMRRSSRSAWRLAASFGRGVGADRTG